MSSLSIADGYDAAPPGRSGIPPAQPPAPPIAFAAGGGKNPVAPLPEATILRLGPGPGGAEDPLAAVLARLGIGPRDFEAARLAAGASGSAVADELVAAGLADEEALAAAIAEALGVASGWIGAGDRIIDDEDAPVPDGVRLRHLRTCDSALRPTLFLAPPLEALGAVAAFLKRMPQAGERIVVTTPGAIGRHRAARTSRGRSERARLSLAADHARWSARTVLTAPQGAALAGAGFSALLALHLFGAAFWTALHWGFSLLFFGCTLFRLGVLLDFDAERGRQAAERRAAPREAPPGPIPVYTVLVALYQERDMAEELVEALCRLHWPRSRLDVKFVCEADDPETVEALRAAIPTGSGFEIVVTPPSLPRTKPKALNYALPLARGEFLVLYDAEDRPHPDQLQAAWEAFEAGGPRLACVQAPLTIRNGAANWFAALFAIEYAVLFRATLPWLARRGLPLPLGGTSNHFRASILADAGGWDSHNVAEDADLGIRLARLGCRIGTIEAPTGEDAPTNWTDWRNQRTRWIKGWMQTWLVHMREPARLRRDVGLRGFLSFQILFIGMIAASLMHAVFLGHLAGALLLVLRHGVPALYAAPLALVDLANVLLATLVFAVLARKVLDGEERRTLSGRLWSLWAYWLLVSLAGLRAFVHLCRQPHAWEKTPHRVAQGALPPAPLPGA